MIHDTQATLLQELRATRILPVLVFEHAAQSVPVCAALQRGGIGLAEITLRTDAALNAIEQVATHLPHVRVGAGTVLSVSAARDAVAAGAQFVVAPGLSPAVVEWCVGEDIPVFPGVVTPSEVEQAMRLGLSTLKFFPAEAAGGVAYLTAISAPYRQVQFIPTGGVSRSSLTAYLRAPSVLACGGSWLTPASWLVSAAYAEIEAEARRSVALVRDLPSDAGGGVSSEEPS